MLHYSNLCFLAPLGKQKKLVSEKNNIQPYSYYSLNICHINDCINKIWQACYKTNGSRRYLNEWDRLKKFSTIKNQLETSFHFRMGILQCQWPWDVYFHEISWQHWHSLVAWNNMYKWALKRTWLCVDDCKNCHHLFSDPHVRSHVMHLHLHYFV